MEVLAKGSYAWYDSLIAGLVKCRVVSIGPDKPSMRDIRIAITGGHPHVGYSRGQELVTNPLHVFPRKAVKVRARTYTVSPFSIKEDPIP